MDRLSPELREIIDRAEAFILKVLGPFEPFLEEIPSLLRITSGATATRSRKLSTPPLKIKGRIDCNPGTVPYIKALAEFYGYCIKTRVVNWNRVEFVTKNWKTDRSVAPEPEGSMPFQLAFDTYVKRRLRRFRTDLSDQTANQEDAKSGSIHGDFATIDLSMASDTVAFNTVAWLIPMSWHKYLCSHRSPFYRLGGRTGKYAKFSSMGNGATFALETLIFRALCEAVGSKRCHVYGDDITIETELAPLLIKALTFFGFKVNTDKSFTEGPYRESCGKHYYEGNLITPFYLRSEAEWDVPNTCHNVNGLVSICKPLGRLMDLCVATINDNRLPLVPPIESSTAGVIIDVHSCYEWKVLRLFRSKQNNFQSLAYMGLVRKTRIKRYCNVRGLTLWHFRYNAGYQGSSDAATDRVSSSHTLSLEKFARKWMLWTPSMAGASPNQFWLGALLSRA